MVNQSQLDELQVEKIKAEIESQKALASKLRAEGTFIRRKDAILKQEKEESDTTVYEQRIYEFTGDVDDDSVGEAITALSEWRARSKDDITLRLSSPGGYVIPGLALYDYVLGIRREGIKVYTVALGWAASMGGILLQAGTKRYIAPNAHILIHNVASTARGKLPELEDEVDFLKRLEDRGSAILAERSTMTVAQIKKKMNRRDWWLGAEEAVTLGFADDLWPPKRKNRR